MIFCTNFREVPSCSASNSEEPNLKKTNKGHNKHLDGHFLTLATPIPTSSPPSLFNSSTSFPFHYQECPEFESPPLQVCGNKLISHCPLSSNFSYLIIHCWLVFHLLKGNIEDQMAIPPGYRLYNQQKQPLYSFFLPSVQIGQTTARIQNSQEVGENIDLNLKLWI